MSISWQELADLTHATQVAQFNFCTCEEQEEFPYKDCPRDEGKCDQCGALYELGSRGGRCGDCGNCANHCTHEKVIA